MYQVMVGDVNKGGEVGVVVESATFGDALVEVVLDYKGGQSLQEREREKRGGMG